MKENCLVAEKAQFDKSEDKQLHRGRSIMGACGAIMLPCLVDNEDNKEHKWPI